MLRLCGVIVLGLCAALLLREKNKSLAILAAAVASLAILGHLLESGTADAVQTIANTASSSGFSAYAQILLRALGIAYLSTFTAELCQSAGEGMLAWGATLAGKAELILLSLPMVSQLLKIAAGLL